MLIFCRFRRIPQWGQTIRRFTNNVSEMKKLAARDYEDLLQCCIPAFEGLLEEPHNKRLMKLLYRTAEWHGLAKLRIHTDLTLDHLEELTKEFGLLMRQFRDQSCSQFQTVELPQEVEARKRQQQPNANAMASNVSPTPAVPSSTSTSRKLKTLNISTYKFHSLGDYVRMIRLFGGTDSFSTQLVRFFYPGYYIQRDRLLVPLRVNWRIA
ncbi:hypothetical protein BJV78DRAFT_1133218 [Lactifluus subvellereus]|nr:hypothetical protein BJV78DRAFT_1133218 [Lactifluus subvellereus]